MNATAESHCMMLFRVSYARGPGSG